ncbi:MAG: hypothetical protein AABW47_04170 [Nanoarchaeota archaeon]
MLNKKVFLLFALVLLFDVISAIRINEVEMNPLGDDAGNEWVELYNEGEISLEGYQLINKDGGTINLSGSFNGYFVYTFSKQWLDNTDESVSLYKSLELIDKADLLAKKDDKNNDLTYQLCSNYWEFINSTKGKENDCVSTNEANPLKETTPSTTSPSPTKENSTSVQIKEESVPEESVKQETIKEDEITASQEEPETINLTPITLNAVNSKDIKSEDNKEFLKRNLPFYGIISFCIIFGALFLLNKRKNRNEFRE